MKKFAVIIFLAVCNFTYPAKLFVNQAGYIPSLPKYVYYNAAADSFFVVESSTGIIFYRGAFQYVSSDPATGMSFYRGDFSGFSREGVYYIKTSTNEISFTFSVNSNVYDQVFRKSLKAFYYQRCGSTLLAVNAGAYNRQACHTSDAVFHSSTGQSGYHMSVRGWHDAGDYGKYIVNAGISAGTLLMAYEQFPEKFSAEDLNIPESGNGIPDILDEVRYEIDWFLAMQHSNGGIYFKITPEQFEAFVMPVNATATRYIYQLSTTATGDFIAVVSRFARLYRQYDSSYASLCLSAALNAWNYLSAQTGIVPAGGFHNPPGTATGEYGDGDDSDERLWAAAELFETTGSADYKDYFDFNYNLHGVLNSTMWWGNVRSLAQLTYLFSKQSSADISIKNSILAALNSYCTYLLARRNSNAIGVTLVPGEYTWGSNSSVLNNAILLIYDFEKTGNIDLRNAALDQVNYILGINGTQYCYVTGIGQKRVMHPHHRPSQADGITEPIPGLLAGGPDQYLDDPVLQQYYTSSTPPALCYIDDVGSYASNEIAINWNAPLVFVSGYFNFSIPSGVKDESGLNFPRESRLFQNYPNPFNPYTKIKFNVVPDPGHETSYVVLKIYDIIGNQIATLVNEDKSAGTFEVTWNAANAPSGIYFSRLNSGVFSETRKMILVK